MFETMFDELKQFVDEQNEEAARYLVKHDLGIDPDGMSADEIADELSRRGISGSITNSVEHDEGVKWFILFMDEKTEKFISGGKIDIVFDGERLTTTFSQVSEEGLVRISELVEEDEENEDV